MTTETKTKHTPGPWRINFSDGSGDGEIIVAGQKPHEEAVAVVRWGPTSALKPKEIADARLIAAAPQKLEALEFIKAWFLNLEEGPAADAGLAVLRKKFHAPVHKALDDAIRAVKGTAHEQIEVR